MAPAMNATIEHAVVPTPITYSTANTIALVPAATIEPSVYRVMRARSGDWVMDGRAGSSPVARRAENCAARGNGW